MRPQAWPSASPKPLANRALFPSPARPLAEGPGCFSLRVKECGQAGRPQGKEVVSTSFLLPWLDVPHPACSPHRPEPLPHLQLSHLGGLDLSPK